MFSNNDAELTKMLLEKLERNEKLGFSWRSRLNWLLENGSINETQFNDYTEFH